MVMLCHTSLLFVHFFHVDNSDSPIVDVYVKDRLKAASPLQSCPDGFKAA